MTRLPLDHERAAERRRLHIREVAEDGAEGYETVGEELKAARMRLGEDLRSVAAALRIRAEHLEAIEEGAFDKLPGRAYAIGFVRAYAEYLGLDPAVIVARFKAEAGGIPEPSPEPALFDEPEEQREQPQGMLIGLIVLFVIAIGAAAYFGKAADKMLGERMAGDAGRPAAAVSQDETQPASESAPAAAAPTTTTTPETPAPSAATPAPATESAPAAGHSLGAVESSSRITIKALRDGVWLRVEDQASGEVLFTRTLKAQDKYNVPNRPNLVLVTRDGGALELTLDGTPIGRAGGPGSVVADMALNPDILAGRLPPAPAASAPAPNAAPGAQAPNAQVQAASPTAGAPAAASVPHRTRPKPATPPAVEVAPLAAPAPADAAATPGPAPQ